MGFWTPSPLPLVCILARFILLNSRNLICILVPPLPRYGPLTITLTLHVAGLLIVVATIAGLKAAFVAVAMATMAFEVGGPETGGVTARAATGGATTIASRRSDRNRIRG